MRVGIVVDSACDLPFEFFQHNQIPVLPIRVHLDGQTLLDDRNPEVMQQYLDPTLATAVTPQKPSPAPPRRSAHCSWSAWLSITTASCA